MFKFSNKIKVNSIVTPYLLNFHLQGFSDYRIKSLSFNNIEINLQFTNFRSLFISCIGKKYFPIIRLSDGEYSFLLGDRPPARRNEYYTTYIAKYFKFIVRKLFIKKFVANTLPGISSGLYSKKELKVLRHLTSNVLKEVSNNGTLALHLTYSDKPFQEKFHKDLFAFFRKIDVNMHSENYVHFYFIYALLTHPDNRISIFNGSNLMLINSFDELKKNKIEKTLVSYGCKKIEWVNISAKRSFYDKLPENLIFTGVDMIFVGAGVGKFNIFNQLSKIKLNIPIVDVGVLFEYWANLDLNNIRPYIYNENLVHTTRK